MAEEMFQPRSMPGAASGSTRVCRHLLQAERIQNSLGRYLVELILLDLELGHQAVSQSNSLQAQHDPMFQLRNFSRGEQRDLQLRLCGRLLYILFGYFLQIFNPFLKLFHQGRFIYPFHCIRQHSTLVFPGPHFALAFS
jgi:hypothetical protein